MKRFNFSPTALSGVTVVQRMQRSDERGFLARIYCATEFGAMGLSRSIAQINHTMTKNRGAVRGLHFQRRPYDEAKLVTCLKGEVFDVAVDLRRSSPTFLQWHGERLTADNQRSLFIPEGFAHGFQALANDCELLYLHSAPYTPAAEGGIHPKEPKVAIDWPLPISELSERDAGRAVLTEEFEDHFYEM
jgi:dTDP-4-dehydrorhamnose 3,5-epimerase